jgi:hypothetical protein
MKKLLGFLLASAFVFTVPPPAGAQESTKQPTKEARWEGTIIRVNSDNSTLDVRQVSGHVEKTIHYDAATAWNSQYHASKTVSKIDASQVKEGDRVICVGTFNDKGEFHATTISRRMSHSPH